MTTDMGLGKGRYLKKSVERAIQKENEDFYRKMKFVVEKNRKKVPVGATFGSYGKWVERKTK